jgi:hypothetical protein
MTESDELTAAIQDAAPKLAEALNALRSAARVINDLGAVASTLQREGQDVEGFGDPSPELRAFLDGSFLQRTGSVNTQSARFAEHVRQLTDAIKNLDSDGQKVIALLGNP